LAETKRAEKTRKLKYKEERELETMEATILAAEEKIAGMETMFAAPDFYAKHGTDWETLDKQLDSARREVARLYARWEELERIKKGVEAAG
jgi:ATP-binding cassette subfamily F protein uup